MFEIGSAALPAGLGGGDVTRSLAPVDTALLSASNCTLLNTTWRVESFAKGRLLGMVNL